MTALGPAIIARSDKQITNQQKRDIHMTTATTTFKSRWGFHPCDFTTFTKIKLLHKWYWRTVYDFHRWHRWWRKEPQNRRRAEPRYCPLFVENVPWYKPAQVHGVAGFKVYPKTVVDHGVVDLCRSARTPRAEPIAPLDEETRRRIDTLYGKLTSYLNQ